MTELHGTMTGHPNDGEQPVIGSVGCTLPFFQTKTVVVTDDNVFERECAPGERGVLALGGPTVTQGYVDSSLDDAYIIKGMPDGNRWGNTGDVGAIDERGYVWLYGRSKDVIIRGGHNIDPKPVEEVLVQFPGVQLAAMVGKPDASKGELPVAYLQIRPGAEVDLEALRRFCANEVHERAALPVDIIVLDAMPLTAVGKIAKPVLKIDILQRTVDAIANEVLGGGCRWTISIDTAGLPTANIQIDPDSGATQLQADALARRLAAFEFRSQVSFAPGLPPLVHMRTEV
jgi:fatty-acyl-CoA synthase